MKKRIKKLQALVLAIVMVFSVLQGVPGLKIFDWATETEAASIVDRLNGLRNTFPGGKFWNHKVTAYSNNADSLLSRWDESYQNSVTGSPCKTHAGVAASGQYDCNVFDGAIQCDGFARKVFFDVFGQRISQLPKRYDKNIAVGDYVRINNNGHSAIVLGINGDRMSVVECNLDNNRKDMAKACMIRWDYSYSISSITYYKRATNYNDVNVAEHDPEGYLDAVWSGPGQITVSGWALDRDCPGKQIKVHIYVGGPAGSGECHEIIANTQRNDVDSATGGMGAWHGFHTTFTTNKTGNQQIYAYGINVDKNGNDNGKNNPQLVNVHTTNIPPKVIYSVNTGGVTDRKNKEAKISGSLSPAGNANSWGFYIGTDKSSMQKCTVSAGSTASSDMAAYVSKYFKLSPGTTYYYQVWAYVNDQEKKGSVGKFTTTAAKPDKPVLKIDVNSKDVGIGDNPSVSWNAVDQADYYKLYLYNEEGTLVETADNVNGTKYAFTKVETSGKYSATVEAVNEVGSKGDSNVVTINVHPDVTVTFMDADSFVDVDEDYVPAVLGEKTVHWGKSADTPADPSHTGYTFKKWEGIYSDVKEDVVVKAVYDIKQYTVKFVDSMTSEVIDSQKVDYYSSATPPDFEVKDGYAKAGYDGWDKDYKKITDNVMLFSCIGWYNENFPVFARIKSAVREYDAAESDNEGYTVTVKLTNNENSTTKGRIVVALKTKEGKLLTTTESSAFAIKKGTQDKEYEVFVPYDKAASFAEVYVVGQYKDAVPFTTTCSNNAMMEIDQSAIFTDWSIDEPEEGAKNVETRTEYRYKDKEVKTSTSTSLSGYTQESSNWVQSGSGNIDYVSSFPSGFNTGNGYYQAYHRSPVGAYENATNKRTVSTSTIAFLYWHWCRGTYTSGPINRLVSDCWTSEFNTFHAFTCGGLGYDGNAGAFYHADGNQCRDTYWWLTNGCWNGSQLPVQRCSYTDYVKQFTYSKWSDFSDWSTTKVTASSTREVETRTVYRYQVDKMLEEDNTGEERTIKGSLGAEFAGKEASLFIYKVDEASDFTNEFVSQTKLDDEGNYEFTFKLREEPSVKTGDLTAVLGIEGTSTAIYLDTIEAPKKEYTVNFYNYKEEIIKTEKVVEGESAELPEEALLERTGYTFTKWSGTNVNVSEDINLYPEYKINTYNVVFVDWSANTVQVKKFEYGAQLITPIADDAEEGYVAEWDAIADGNTTVTGDMIVCTRYTKKTCSVVIKDFDNKVVSSENVEYGSAAKIEQPKAEPGKIFLGWKDVSEGDDRALIDNSITKNVILCPVYVFEETVAAPVADKESNEYNAAVEVKLTCDTEDAIIYYTLDGTNPKSYGSNIYTGPITIDDSVELQFYACKLGMNDSPVARELYVVNYDGAVSDWMLYDDIPSEILDNAADYNIYGENGYRYKDVKKVTKLEEAAALENTGWSLSDKEEYTDYSDWLKELPENDGSIIAVDVDSRPIYTDQYQYKYSHYKYSDGASVAYSASEPEGIESEYVETEAFNKPLSVAGFDANKKPYYVYDGAEWFSQERITGQVQTGTEYRWRSKISTYTKWSDYSIDDPEENETREKEETMIYRYNRPVYHVVKVHRGSDVTPVLVKKDTKVDISDIYYIEGKTMDGVYRDDKYQSAWDIENDKVTSSMDLYIKYTSTTCKVSFYNEDGSLIESKDVQYGDKVTPPQMPEKEGYIFAGWGTTDYSNVKYDMDLIATYIAEDKYVRVALDSETVELNAGESAQLTAIVTPKDRLDAELEWTSSDETVAKVSSEGKVTGISSGTAEITVTAVETGEKATCKVTIIVDKETTLSILKNSKLSVDKNGFLRGVKVGTVVSDVLKDFDNENIVVKDIDGNVLGEDDFVGTGATIYLMNGDEVLDLITAVVTGDVNSDGELTGRDLSKLARKLIDKEVLSEICILASDVNGDGEVNNKDLAMLSQIKLGKLTL